MNLRSIKAKVLVAFLALSLLPLILFVVISRFGMIDVRERVDAELIQDAKKNFTRLAMDQAEIANAMLDKIEVETRMLAFSTEALLRNPSVFDRGPSSSSLGEPGDRRAVSGTTLAPGVSMAAAKPDLDLFGNLDEVFALIQEGDPHVDAIYIGTESGVYREYPWVGESTDPLLFTLESTFEREFNNKGTIPGQLREMFSKNSVSMSQHAEISIDKPGKKWFIRDAENSQVFSVRQGKSGLDIYHGFDPRLRPWYKEAVNMSNQDAANRNRVVWTKYADWSQGAFLFDLEAEFEHQMTNKKVSPDLARIFKRKRQVILKKDSPILTKQDASWLLEDEDGKKYTIIKKKDKLHVYSLDILTCSKAVWNPEDRLAGVVGLDISMSSISTGIINTPEEIPGYAFLLNGKGELIEQEKADMFIPKTSSGIRQKMTDGGNGFEFDAESATYVFYAPIRSIGSLDEKSAWRAWSVGISMPESEITRLAGDIQQKMNLVFRLLVGILALMIILVIYAALRMSKGITEPITVLEKGAIRIGSGDLEHYLDVRTGDELEKLANTFNEMAKDLKSYLRIESELGAAHHIQMSFLKKEFPPYPDRRDFSLYATIESAREVGGDLYDFSLMNENRLVFYVGDVSDKGVPAALVMAKTMTLMTRAFQQSYISPAEILRQVNVALSKDNESAMFVTLFIGVLDVSTGELHFSNAGHNPPLILDVGGAASYLTLPDGLVLGAMSESEYRDDSLLLGPGEMIVTYTDGVTEAMNPQRELFSEARLQETLAKLAGRSVEDTVGVIISSVTAHAAGAPQSDDIAVLALRRN
ncbi:MAG: SpoIIE family protein phosphatase [Candidatus Thiodiazotropha sp. (ex Epidulcina cf. delphinae)]|nr:SpoIIE family protein phosphatase [Candidatus Thiodiazotropha sp. (ex Epidulcina cf. delphinae)]